MGMLPFYMFMQATGTLDMYQQSVKFWTEFFQPVNTKR